MNLTAKLAPLYGGFHEIQTANYPFNHTFVEYVDAIAVLGMEKQLSPDCLIGFIEDGLLGDDQLPDILQGNETVKFRIRTENPNICAYFESSPLTNKYITLAIIRMTLRLANRFGTSLARLTYRIHALSDPSTQVVETPKIKVTPRSKPVALPKPANDVPVTPTTVKTEPAIVEMVPVVEEVVPPEKILKGLEALVAKGDELLTEEPDRPVVATNPALSDFF